MAGATTTERVDAARPATGAGPAGTGRTGMPLSRALALVLAVLAFAVASQPMADNSTLTHLATGRLILERWSVPEVDVYSFTAPGRPWVVQSWLASALYAGLERTAGLWSVRALHGLLASAVVTMTWSLTAPIRSLFVRVGLVSAVVGIGTMLWPPRPLLFGLVGLAAVLLVLDGRGSPRWLLPVFALWGATHGSFPMGLAVIAAVAAGAWLDERRLPLREVRAAAWASLGTLAIVLGPLGPDGLVFPVRLLLSQGTLAHVNEWQAPDWSSPPEWIFVALALAAAGVFARCGARWRQLAPAGLGVVLGLMAVRNLSLGSLLLVAAIAPSLAGRPTRTALGAGDRGPVGRGLALAAVALGALLLAAVASSDPLDLRSYPVAEVDRLEEQGLLGDPDVRLLTHDVVGNYLTLRYGTGAQVFIDDRVDMYPAELVGDYVDLMGGGDVQAALDRWRPDVVLWRADEQLARWLRADPRWDVVDDEGDHVVLCRADSPVRPRCG